MKIWALFFTMNEYDATEQLHGFWPSKPRVEELGYEILKTDDQAEEEHILKVWEGGPHRVSFSSIKFGGTTFELREETSISFDLSIAP